MADTILDDQKAPMVITAADDQNNPVPLPAGVMAFDTSDHTIAMIDNTDPKNPLFVTTGKLGGVQLQATFTPADGYQRCARRSSKTLRLKSATGLYEKPPICN